MKNRAASPPKSCAGGWPADGNDDTDQARPIPSLHLLALLWHGSASALAALQECGA